MVNYGNAAHKFPQDKIFSLYESSGSVSQLATLLNRTKLIVFLIILDNEDSALRV